MKTRLNLLILLGESTARAHEQVAQAVGRMPQIDPFILGRRGFERSVRCFASKFAGIRRALLFGQVAIYWPGAKGDQ